jgi:hypothetical protein
MHRVTGVVGSIVGKARGLVGRGASAEERRQTFYREFGQYPSDFEASGAVREQLAREVVRPALVQRAQAVQQSASASGADGRPGREAEAAFTRAYQAAVDLKLAEKGKTYQDYLGLER